MLWYCCERVSDTEEKKLLNTFILFSLLTKGIIIAS